MGRTKLEIILNRVNSPVAGLVFLAFIMILFMGLGDIDEATEEDLASSVNNIVVGIIGYVTNEARRKNEDNNSDS